ncbi:MAG: RluA family pseudouridine synthase [Deltaproteobacteria bacterium]|nr:RluA family pseudouridine synthase [Deltaproteobacteria bacterium]
MRLSTAHRGLRFDQAIHRVLLDRGQRPSVREIRQALRAGRIRVDGCRVAPGALCAGDERIDLGAFTARGEAVLVGETDARVEVLHEDDNLLVLSKPAGMPTGPLVPGESGTLLGVAVGLAPEIATAGPPLEGGLVHRLDRDTTGVVVFAKTLAQRELLREAFRRHDIEKRYLAIVQGGLSGPVVVVGAISTAEDRRRVRVRLGHGLPARTEFAVRSAWSDRWSLLEAVTCTGRRHQVRAHLACLGRPIVGDVAYGGLATPSMPRVALHASRVTLPSGASFAAEMAADMRDFLLALGPVVDQPRGCC